MKKQINPRIRFFKEVSGLIDSVGDLDKLLDIIIQTATKVMEAKASSLLLLDKKTNKLYFHTATGEKKDEVKRFEVGMGEGIAGWVAKEGRPLLVKDVSKEPRWNRRISDEIGFETHSIACVPLKIKDEVIGVVEIIDREDGSPIREEDMEILTAFADLAASAIEKAQNIKNVKDENIYLRKELDQKYQIIGESEQITRVIMDAKKVANSKATTLIYGESGTGKELVARLIHSQSPRREKPFLIINCGAIPETLLERELFGHEKGAFTGADQRKIGLFEEADDGTLFLDEIGETTPAMQVKLLRVLQEGQFFRIGGTASITVDVRIIAATNRELEKDVESGRFREDLFYRLNVIRINLPPLRERKEDIPLLVKYLLEKKSLENYRPVPAVTKEAMEVLINHQWYGNVRELENAIERAVVMGDGKEIKEENLPLDITKWKLFKAPAIGISLKEAIEKFKKDFLKETIKYADGNKNRAAKILGIERTYLHKLIKELDINT
ncbi:MAG: sigma-54-dependent Fis family transcriptional regulator [Nitrospinae bacterium]|nr:sigma-54-dependent Fis family transcriptional regulator [Nitrospinota bacterium]